MELYSAIDLHSNNSRVGIIDAQQTRVLSRKLANHPNVILNTFPPILRFKENLASKDGLAILRKIFMLGLIIHAIHLPFVEETFRFTKQRVASKGEPLFDFFREEYY